MRHRTILMKAYTDGSVFTLHRRISRFYFPETNQSFVIMRITE